MEKLERARNRLVTVLEDLQCSGPAISLSRLHHGLIETLDLLVAGLNEAVVSPEEADVKQRREQFWRDAFVAAGRAGSSPYTATDFADEGLRDYDHRFGTKKGAVKTT